MKKEKIIKIIITIIYIVIAIGLFICFLDAAMHSDAMGINFISSLPLLLISLFLLVYAIKSAIDIIKDKTKITIIDKIIIILFSSQIILALLMVILYKYLNWKVYEIY